jgi:phosphatidylglycerophosphate synthase
MKILELISLDRIRIPANATPVPPIPPVALRSLVNLCCFSALMFFGSCPTWFLSLLIVVGLLQLSGWLFLKIHDLRDRGARAAAPFSRWNTFAQLLWITVLAIPLLCPLFFPVTIRVNFVFQLGGYLALAALQIGDFYQRFSRYHPLLLADLRRLTATP